MRNVLSLTVVGFVAVSSVAYAGDCRHSRHTYYRTWYRQGHHMAYRQPSQHTTHYRGRPAAQADIVDTAVSAGSFKTLVAAVQAAGLVDALKGEGPLTVFAPTDDAFAKLPAGTLDNLLKPENKETLQAILTYHVVPGKVTAAQAAKLSSATTLQGQDISIAASNGGVKIDNANVVKTDIACSNGIIHVIDAVILPSNDTNAAPAPAQPDIVDTAVAAGSFNTLVAAVKAAGLVETLKGDGPFTVFAPTDDAFRETSGRHIARPAEAREQR